MSSEGKPFDPRRYKAQERAGFNRIADRYGANAQMRESLARSLLHAADLAPGQAVLDLASGPGLLARHALEAVGPTGWVLASDLAEGMLHSAQADTPGLGACGADAEQLSFAPATFDRVLMGLGLFVCPHPQQVLLEIRRTLRPGGRVALSVWGPPEQVPLITCAQDCLSRIVGPARAARPSVFRLGGPGVMARMLAEAGFRAIQVQDHPLRCDFADAAQYWQAFLDLAGGVTEALAKLPEETRLALARAVEADLLPYRSESGFRLPAQTLIATAQA